MNLNTVKALSRKIQFKALSLNTDVLFHRRINIGSRYQAEVPELRQRSAVELDHHRAELVWVPLTELEEKPDFQGKGEKRTIFHCCCIT